MKPVLVLFGIGDSHSGVFPKDKVVLGPKSSLVGVLEDALRGAHATWGHVKMGPVARLQAQLQQRMPGVAGYHQKLGDRLGTCLPHSLEGTSLGL